MEEQKISDKDFQKNLEHYKASLEFYKARLQGEELAIQKWSAGFKEIVRFATLIIKSLILINGGSLLALLAFLGNVSGKSCKISSNISCPFVLFSVGLGLAVLGAMLAYIYQSIELELKKETNEKRIIWRYSACCAAVLSLLLFIAGVFSSLEMFSSLSLA